MGRSHMKLFLNALDPLPATFAWLAALFKLPATFSPSDATPRPNALTLMKTYYLYKTWICAFAPPSFIAGLPHPELSEETEESSESEESMYTDESAATYETPPRRLLPHEMARDPNARDDEDDDDDAITDDSHISGADGPEAYSKASLVRDHCMSNDRWVKGMASWVREAGCFDVDEKLIFNDEEVRTAEKEFKEQPRTVSSMHLDKPDYLRVHLSLKRKRTTD
ncbi:hypothetical protein C8F01DRAFT_1134086 [Mycena amicta]|nr:hypothetical protein C8F01DRAFT_1134086 [Mycena amicta]